MAIFQSFDPTSMGPKDLRAIFVARKKLLDYGLKRIQESGAGKSKKHLLLVGPRGSGKTHFQLLTYYAVKEKFSNKWLALKFPEEEYSITSMADLLLQILHEMGQEEVEKANELYEILYTSDEDTIKEKATKFIKEYHRRTGKNLLLFLENFQDLAEQMDTSGMQALRAFIQENDFLMLFPSALSVFRQVADYKEPFYGFFEVVPLKEITLKDTERLFLKLAKWEGRKELIEEIKAERERIKGLFNLTGGSVRLIVLLYHFISHKALSEVEEALYNLLNELTPYYQYQMMALSPSNEKY